MRNLIALLAMGVMVAGCGSSAAPSPLGAGVGAQDTGTSVPWDAGAAADTGAAAADTSAAADTGPAVCVPDCQKKLCGSDGCGGTCGACGADEGCVEGVCKLLGSPDVCAKAQCDANAYCLDQNGQPKCVCKTGWEGDGYSCVDANECKVNNGGCPETSLCKNEVGAPNTCVCKKGYEGNGYVCNDVNECQQGVNCANHATCKNTVGSYECVCGQGYKGDGYQSCVDVNECDAGTATCPQNATCNNTLGSYKCVCEAGYELKGGACVDVNECADNTAVCDKNASCGNTTGGYTCTCKTNYEGNGKVCSLKDLCKTAGCDKNASCTQGKDGKATCKCAPGYDGSGQVCYAAKVNLSMVGAIIAPRPTSQTCWDVGCTVTAAQMKKVVDAAAKAAIAFKNPYVTAAGYAAKILPVDQALAAIAGHTSLPDVGGNAVLLPSGQKIELPKDGTTENKLTPQWKGKTFKNVSLTPLVALQVDLVDKDLLGDDPIGQVKLSYSDLVKALTLGQTVPVPTQGQGSGSILFTIVQLDYAQLCGDSQCTGTENQTNCPGDCTGGTTQLPKTNDGSCKGFCGDYSANWMCQCDSYCAKMNPPDCCPDKKALCGG